MQKFKFYFFFFFLFIILHAIAVSVCAYVVKGIDCQLLISLMINVTRYFLNKYIYIYLLLHFPREISGDKKPKIKARHERLLGE